MNILFSKTKEKDMYIRKFFKPKLINGVYYVVALLTKNDFSKTDLQGNNQPEFVTVTGIGVTIRKAKTNLMAKLKDAV